MTSVTVQSALEANLTALSPVNRDVASLLREAVPALDVSFVDTPQNILAGLLDGRQLCSKHRPRDEAERLVESVDLVENAVVVVMGFGMGYHVQALAERIGKAGAIIVYEPDIAMMRAVLERVDHSRWMQNSNIVWMVNAGDRGTLAGKLKGAESILAHGVKFLEHPASRDRLGQRAIEFSRMLSGYMDSARTILMTNLVRASETVRNMVLNLDHYLTGDGIADLENAAVGSPAVVVSAGPSLRRNMHLLSQPGVRDRVVIIAVQTVLKPLLQAGIKPHFVTALDYHEISKRFYEGLREEDVRGVTLVAEPKVHPAVLDAFPGTIRCSGAKLLDDLLGDQARDMGSLPDGTTVAHLSVYLARHLGCDPIALIGQDLGFTDGLYYGPGTAIDDVWAPELNPFNTIEMMQWQRIVRHRKHLQKVEDVNGRSMYSDAQMLAYLQQFERDFSAYKAQGIRVIDASEGGAVKQHVEVIPLNRVLDEFAVKSHTLPSDLPIKRAENCERLRATKIRLGEIRREIASLRELSRRTHRLIEKMIDDQHDTPKMQRHFAKLNRFQAKVATHQRAFKLLEYINQVGSFNRRKSDRRMHMQGDLPDLERQRLELERDRENVAWIKDAADEMMSQLLEAEHNVFGDHPAESVDSTESHFGTKQQSITRPAGSRVAALIAVDPDHSSIGAKRSLGDHLYECSILQTTLQRLCESQTLDSIVLIVPQQFDVEPLLDRQRLRLPVEVERCDGDSPFDESHRAISAARIFSDTSWRGGIAGMSVYDELLCPAVMDGLMQKRNLSAALLVGPDWPLVDVTSPDGCDSLVRRHWEEPKERRLVITQSPPGLCGCVINADLMRELANATTDGVRPVGATIGAALVYQPQSPRGDIIGTDANVQIDHRTRSALTRATYDLPRWRNAIRNVVGTSDHLATSLVAEGELPQHVILELCVERTNHGEFREHLLQVCGGPPQRKPLTLPVAQRVFEQLGASGDGVLTLGGVGDPLLHPRCYEMIALAKECGVRAVHLRTELLCDQAAIDQLLESGVDIISVDLHADSDSTYAKMMGTDRYRDVISNIQYLLQCRGAAPNQLALPWIVPRMQRCATTFADIEPFYDRWLRVLGTAVIEGRGGGDHDENSLEPAVTPAKVVQHELKRRMLIHCDGTVPVSECDGHAREHAGYATLHTLSDLWCELLRLRSLASSPLAVLFP